MISTRGRQFYFFHIPRTAGTTFSYSILTRYFKPKEICEPFNYHVLLNLQPRELGRYRLFRGHFYYFLYRLLPKRPLYLCFLRNPLERVASSYQLMMNDPTHYHHEKIRGMGSFQAFIQSEYMLPDGVVRTLAADLDPKAIASHCRLTRGQDFYVDQAIAEDVYHFRPARAELEIAKRRLEQFEFLGLQENFDDSLKLLARTFDWQEPLDFETRNVSAIRHVELGSLPKEALDLLVSYHQLDLELYEFAINLFKQRLASAGIEGVGVKHPVNFGAKRGWTESRFKPREGRRFTERPLYFFYLPFAIWPDLSLEMERAFFLPSETCRAWSYPDLFAVPPDLFSHYRFYRGTFFLPLARAVSRELEYMTFLRNPISCMHRIYKFILAHPENPFYNKVQQLGGFVEYAESWSDPMVKALSIDLDPMAFAKNRPLDRKTQTISEIVETIMGGRVTEKDLEVAKRRLAQFAFVGVEERFLESLGLLSRTFGWNELSTPERFNPLLKDPQEPSDNVRAAVREYCSLDLQLYEFGADLFERRLQSTKSATTP